MRRMTFALGLLLTLLLLTIAPFSVLAIGSSAGWTVVIYNQLDTDPIEAELIVISDQGLQDSITIPDAIFEPLAEGEFGLGRLSISPDLRYLTVTYLAAGETAAPSLPLLIYDLETDDSFEVEMPSEFPLVYNFVYSPDGKQMAVGYVGGEDDNAVEEQVASGGLMQVELATGEILAQIEMDDIIDAVGGSADELQWAIPGYWNEAGLIPFVPACFFCNEIEVTHYWVWNPADNSITETEQYYFPFGAQLPESGEVVVPRLNRDYPIGDPDPNAYLPESNVIEFYSPTDDPDNDGMVVFFDETRFPLGGSPWVQDGRGFLTRRQGDPEAVIVFRDGTTLDFTLPSGPVVVVGTPDGAIIVDFIGKVYDYRIVGGEIESEEVVELNFDDNYNLGTVTVVYSTPMGASSAGKPFPFVPAPGSDV